MCGFAPAAASVETRLSVRRIGLALAADGRPDGRQFRAGDPPPLAFRVSIDKNGTTFQTRVLGLNFPLFRPATAPGQSGGEISVGVVKSFFSRSILN